MSASERTLAAARWLADQVSPAISLRESGNCPEGWIFDLEHEGESYNVEVCANVLHAGEEEE